MCGITGILLASDQTKGQKDQLRCDFHTHSQKISHRGPDRSVMIALKDPINVSIEFHRLSVRDTSTKGDQPFKFEPWQESSFQISDRTVYVMCNGEIYNHRKLEKTHGVRPTSGSDCEVIMLMYQKMGKSCDTIKKISDQIASEHAFAILDLDRKTGDYDLFLSSDRYGIRPLFVSQNKQSFCFASELQGLANLFDPTTRIERFPPRHYGIISKKNGILGRLNYHSYGIPVGGLNACSDPESSFWSIKPTKEDLTELDFNKWLEPIIPLLEDAVVSMLTADVPIGCLLSGGLDSSIIAALAARHLKTEGRVLRTFSIGMEGGTDEYFAKLVAKHIGSDHTHIMATEEEFIKAADEDIVRVTGSIDRTTVRASTGQYLCSKWIGENTDIKVLLIGDGSDEVTGGYIYFLKAPTPQAFHDECVRLVSFIHLFDGLRADRCISFFGMEARVPFLYKFFVEYYLSIPVEWRMPKDGVEKWLLRKACDRHQLLPIEVCMRPKEAFSDGVSAVTKSWYQMRIDKTNEMYTDDEFEKRKMSYTHMRPQTKEDLYNRESFVKHFGPNESAAQTIPFTWLPKWCGDVTDPSARILGVYADSTSTSIVVSVPEIADTKGVRIETIDGPDYPADQA